MLYTIYPITPEFTRWLDDEMKRDLEESRKKYLEIEKKSEDKYKPMSLEERMNAQSDLFEFHPPEEKDKE